MRHIFITKLENRKSKHITKAKVSISIILKNKYEAENVPVYSNIFFTFIV